MLAIFVASTSIFASLTIIEYAQIDSISSKLQVAPQITISSTCENTGGIGCPTCSITATVFRSTMPVLGASPIRATC